MQKEKELTSSEARGYPAVTELKNRISAIETLVTGYASRGQPFPSALRGRLVELRNLKSSLARIENRIAAGERQKMFIQPVQTAKGKIG